MRPRLSSVVTLLVVLGVLGLVTALSIPSLMRARIAAGPAPLATPLPPRRAVRPLPLATPLPSRQAVRPLPMATQTPLALPASPALRSAEAKSRASAAPGKVEALAGGAIHHDTEAYDRIDENPFFSVADAPLSTFAVDVDTAAYANVRRFLREGRLPPPDAVRIEELVNYFHYDYPEPRGRVPFSVSTEVGPCPWSPGHRLVSIGLQGRHVEAAARPPLNLVFLLDVSGSMDQPLKLPLLKAAMRLLTRELTARDTVSIVVYAGASGLALPPTSGADHEAIESAIQSLQAGGSTAGGAGIQLAYDVAARSFVEGGVNRVILATDGDFNVGITNRGDLTRLIERERDRGIFLSALGFGGGNYKDATLEQLADRGNGNYSYIDSLQEARKVLVSEAGGTLVTIAKDVKVQVEFNPLRVAGYRLIGYEDRLLRDQDFEDDRKDAGDIGAGHTVTALYEIVPAGQETPATRVPALRYQTPRGTADAARSGELLTVKLRYKEPSGSESRLLSVAVADDPGRPASANLRFATAVAGFGLLLRGSERRGQIGWDQVLDLARASRGDDPDGYRSEFIRLAELARSLSPVASLRGTHEGTENEATETTESTEQRTGSPRARTARLGARPPHEPVSSAYFGHWSPS